MKGTYIMSEYGDRISVGYEAEIAGGESRYTSRRRRRCAVKASSRCHLSLALYQIIASVVLSVMYGIVPLFLPENLRVAFVESPYVLWGGQVLAMYVISFPIFLLMTRGIPNRRAEKSNMSLGEFVVIFMIAEGLAMVGNIISGVLTSLIEGSTGSAVENGTMDMIMSAPLWVVILVVVVIGPIIEELMLRKVFIDKLSVYGDRLAIVVSGVAFGLMHGNLYQLFYAVALGILFGYVYVKTRKIVYSCLLHILVNFFGSVPSMLLLPSLLRIEELDSLYPDGVGMPVNEVFASIDVLVSYVSYLLIQYGLAIAGIVLLLVLTIKRAYRIPNTCEFRLPKKTIPRVAFFNLGAILFFLFSLSNILLTIFPDALNYLLGIAPAVGA